VDTPTGYRYIGLLGFLLFATFFDLKTRKVPNVLVGIAVGVAVVISFLPESKIDLMQSILGGLLGLLIFYYPYAKAYIGAGDTKLFVVIGMFLGPHLAIWAYLFTCLMGGFFATFVAIYQSQLKQAITNIYTKSHVQKNFPYAVAIFAGTVMAIFNCQKLL
jgi:prepilin peptidase CpaA